MAKIQKITAREILDSRGIPTIEGYLLLDTGEQVSAVAPSGESLGKYEWTELRDGETRYDGMGVKKAISYINDLIAPKLLGADPLSQSEIDYWLIKADGGTSGQTLGVNSTMTVSQLVLKAAALSQKMPLYKYINALCNKATEKKIILDRMPGCIVTLINGGKHGNKNLEFQEFQIIPSTSYSYSQALEFAVVAYDGLKKVLEYRNAGIAVSEEGGFVPNLLTNVDALEVIRESLVQRKVRLGVDVYIGLDLAASQFYKNNRYAIKDKSQPLKVEEYIDFLVFINKEYNILVLEDPLEQEDFANWALLNDKIGANTYLVGDDFLAGKKERVQRAIKEKACSGMLIKLNQTGTITELLELTEIVHQANLKTIVSHRLGESNDSFIADLAVGIQADFVKFGAPVRGERVAKYNRLLTIETDLGLNK